MSSRALKNTVTIIGEAFVLLALLGKWADYQYSKGFRAAGASVIGGALLPVIGYLFMAIVLAGIRKSKDRVYYRSLLLKWPSAFIAFMLVLVLSYDQRTLKELNGPTNEYAQYMMHEGVSEANAQQWFVDLQQRIRSEKEIYVVVLVLSIVYALSTSTSWTNAPIN